VVTSVNSGTLKIGADSASATSWASGTNDTVDATRQLFWTPDPNANGTLNAFSVVAQDNLGVKSSGTGVSAMVTVTAVNDAPTVSAPASFTVNEDTAVNLLYTGTPFADVDSTNLTVSPTKTHP